MEQSSLNKPINQFSYEESLIFFKSLDNYFNQSWWFAIRNWMESEGFLSFPGSTTKHMMGDGGLLRHSMHVVRNALLLNEAWGAGFKKWEVAAAGTFHDLGKMGLLLPSGELVPRYRRLRDDEKPKVEGQVWAYNEECPKISQTSYSILITRKFVHLPYHVEEAIQHHDSLYIPENQSRAHNEGRLELILHYSDMWAGHVNEKGAGDRSMLQ